MFPGVWLEELGISARDLSQEELIQANREDKPRKKMLQDALPVGLFFVMAPAAKCSDQPVTVGNIYMMKLTHLVEDKVHAVLSVLIR